jgi:2-polyprenyl-6-methoxyphenol hydroxylase-like FAD-dependent oxidoreductase
MGAQVNELITADGAVRGVSYQGADGRAELRASLVVAADGRFSRLRRLAGVEPVTTTQEVDILWFRLARRPDDPEQAFGRFGGGRILFVVDRDEYWQVGYVIRKGGYQALRAAGLDAFRQQLAQMLPALADRVEELQEWQQIATLSVASDRLRRWHKPGLFFIGDAAHVMSPVGAVGVNYAIYDAVVASNLLGRASWPASPSASATWRACRGRASSAPRRSRTFRTSSRASSTRQPSNQTPTLTSRRLRG